MTPTQARLARLALGWTLDDLAAKAGVGVSTARAFEAAVGVSDEIYGRLRATLEGAGVGFGEGEGVDWITYPSPGHVRSTRRPTGGPLSPHGRRRAEGAPGGT